MTLDEWRQLKAEEAGETNEHDHDGLDGETCIHCGAPAPPTQPGREASLCAACE